MTHSQYSASMGDINQQGFQTPYQAPRTLPQSEYDGSQSQADPYAGQYPPPRPRRRSTQPMYSNSAYGNEYASGSGVFPDSQPYMNTSRPTDDQATIGTNNSGYTRSSGPSMGNSQSFARQNSLGANDEQHDTAGLIGGTAGGAELGAAAGAGLMAATDNASNDKGYYDPHAIPLGEWQQSERETNLINNSQLDHDGNMIEMADTSNRRGSYQQNLMQQQPQPEPQYIEAGYPTVAPPSYLRPDRDGYLPGARGRPQPKRKPRPVAPVAPPVTSPTPIQNQYYPPPPPPPFQPYAMPPPQAYKPPREPAPSCCCYCPAMTCCSCFCMLISLGFVAAGIAMIVYAKVASQQCPACDHSSSFAGICGSCNTILYDGLFYGGIAVTALAAIGVVWRLMMWLCSARR